MKGVGFLCINFNCSTGSQIVTSDPYVLLCTSVYIAPTADSSTVGTTTRDNLLSPLLRPDVSLFIDMID